MKRLTVKLDEDCYRSLKLFCANHNLTVQQFYVKATALYLRTYNDTVGFDVCVNCTGVDPSPTTD